MDRGFSLATYKTFKDLISARNSGIGPVKLLFDKSLKSI